MTKEEFEKLSLTEKVEYNSTQINEMFAKLIADIKELEAKLETSESQKEDYIKRIAYFENNYK